jgi:hypothetical protein
MNRIYWIFRECLQLLGESLFLISLFFVVGVILAIGG